MDVLRMKVLLERYGQLKLRIENSRHRICGSKRVALSSISKKRRITVPWVSGACKMGSHPIQRKRWG